MLHKLSDSLSPEDFKSRLCELAGLDPSEVSRIELVAGDDLIPHCSFHPLDCKPHQGEHQKVEVVGRDLQQKMQDLMAVRPGYSGPGAFSKPQVPQPKG